MTRTITIEVPGTPVAAPPPPPSIVSRQVGGGRARWSQTLTYTDTVNGPAAAPTISAPTYRTETVTEYVDIPCPTSGAPLSLLNVGDAQVTAVPVPSALGLLGVGGLALWMSRRRRQA